MRTWGFWTPRSDTVCKPSLFLHTTHTSPPGWCDFPALCTEISAAGRAEGVLGACFPWVARAKHLCQGWRREMQTLRHTSLPWQEHRPVNNSDQRILRPPQTYHSFQFNISIELFLNIKLEEFLLKLKQCDLFK